MTWGPDGPVVTAPDRVAVPVWELFGMRRVPGDPRVVELPGGVRYLVGAAHRRWPGAVLTEVTVRDTAACHPKGWSGHRPP